MDQYEFRVVVLGCSRLVAGGEGECEVLALISLQPYEQKSEMINSEGAVVSKSCDKRRQRGWGLG